jgi:tripartite-type tricarboxylate transporter receptor subunit TctC
MTIIARPLALGACAVALAVSTLGAPTPALAAYPERPVRLVVPFAPGGGTDQVARLLATGLSQALGQSVVVENKPGAGTVIGTDQVAKSPADGYAVLVATFSHAVNPSLRDKLPYDTATAFAPVALIARGPNVLVVPATSPYKSVAELLAGARAAPKGLTFASQGSGTSAHLAGEMFISLTRANLLHVPYKGAGPALTDLIGGQVDMMFATAAAVSKHVSSGKLRALAVTSPEHSASFPGVSPLAEAVPGYAVESWYGLFVPAGTPQAVIRQLNEAVRSAVRRDDFRVKVESEGLSIQASTPAELDAYVNAEAARWRKVVNDMQMKGK